jgi:Fe-S cluster biogenesis protein NfuA
MESVEFQLQAQKIDQLVQRVSQFQDEETRRTALELVQALMDLHGSGITRVVEVLAGSGEPGQASLERLGNDPLICGLLVLYGVHPVPLDARVAGALERLAPQLRKQSGSAEVIEVTDGLVRIAVHASGSGCHSSPDALKTLVEQAVREVAPEVAEIHIETPGSSATGFVPIQTLQPAAREETSYEESTARY